METETSFLTHDTKRHKMQHIYMNSGFGEPWFDYEDLYRSFVDRMTDQSVFVEVGSWKGKSIAFMGVEIVNSGKKISCYAVDTWLGSQEHNSDSYIKDGSLYDLFIENISPLKDVITPIRKPSVDAANQFSDGSLDIVYIDANHEYQEVKKDIAVWLPKIKKGGIISGHDYSFPWNGVIQAVDESFPDDKINKSCVSSWFVVV